MGKKRRKMLGRADDPEIVALMDCIDTQSHHTLCQWAIEMVADKPLEILHDRHEERLDGLVKKSQAYLAGKGALTDLKKMFQEATKISREIQDPIAQAASKAILTACKTIQTPTNVLGYVFYYAACVAYAKLGLNEEEAIYDASAKSIFTSLRDALKARSIPDETHPSNLFKDSKTC